jgi:hypothetical protein
MKVLDYSYMHNTVAIVRAQSNYIRLFVTTALTAIESFREQTQVSVAGQGLHAGTYHSEADVNEQKYTVFSSLMDIFKKERQQTDVKIAGLQKCLHDATIDLLNTLQENTKLKQQMHELVTWEPRLLPTQGKWS